MMIVKQVIKLVGILFLLFCSYQIIVFLFIKEHDCTYFLEKNQKKYQIQEHFEVIDKEHVYTFEVKDQKKRIYHFQLHENDHKQKQIIQDIESFEVENLTCIYPISLKNKQGEIICREGDKEFTSTYLLKKNDERIKTMIEKLEKKGYQNASWQEDESTKEVDKITYYPQNIDAKEAFYFWDYRGIQIIKKDGVISKELFKIDKYENDQSILVGDTLVVIDSDQSYDFDKIYFISLFSSNVKEMKLKEKISQDSYFVGSVGHFAYLIDRKNIKQYEINLKKKQIKVIGNKQSNAKYYNGKDWETRNIYDFVKEDLFFQKNSSIKVEKEDENVLSVKGIGRVYFIEENAVSYVSDLYPNDRVILFEANELKEVQVVGNQIFMVDNDTVYQYDPSSGLKPVFRSRELLFHSKNMYGVAFQN